MLVKILVDGPYADFKAKPGFQKAQTLSADDEVDYPDWYAQSLVDSKLAEKVDVSKPDPQEEVEAEEVNATDSALAFASENDIDLKDVAGTGAGGRITLGDVKALVNG